MLNRSKLVERLAGIGREQLVQHAPDCVQRQRTGRKLQLASRRHDVRALAGMEDERVSIGANNGGQERIYERHNFPKGVSRSPGFSVERRRYFIVKTTPC